MDTLESCVPPGFRFHPTDEELVGYYLKKKVASQKIDLDVIRDIDLYRIEPWDLQDRCRIGYEEQNEWYFFSHKDKKYPTGTRTNRATMAGFWKATGRDKAVYDKSKLIGMRKTLVFYKGRAPNGQKTDWIMHEYRLEPDENGPPQEEGWVVCRAFRKKASMQSKNMEGWESSYVYDNEAANGVMDPIIIHNNNNNNNHTNRNSFFPKKLLCKQEIESEALLAANYSFITDTFLQLPQLESPLSKRTISLVSQNNSNSNSSSTTTTTTTTTGEINNMNKAKVTDWRELDQFVASQLSQDPKTPDDHDQSLNRRQAGLSSFSHTSDLEALLLLHGGNEREEEVIDAGKLISGFLSTSSSADNDNIGICIFDKLNQDII